LEEAQAALAEVRPLVEQMVDAWRSLEAARLAQEQLEERIRGNGGGIPPQQLADAEEDIERAAGGLAARVGESHERGGLVKDFESGLVDFPSVRDGEPVLLCWRLGEATIGYWHGLEEGFAGRKPV